MLACIPPSIWSNDWQKTPDELIAIVKNSKWEKLFLEAWATATVRSKDIKWAEAFLKVSAKLSKKLSNVNEFIVNLLKNLTDSEIQSLILNVLHDYPNTPFYSGSPAFPLLVHTPYIWNQEISQAVISSIKRHFDSNKQVNSWQFDSALEQFSVKISPTVYHEAVETLTFEESEITHKSIIEVIDKFLAKLKFRFEMKQELLM
jgi:hypothetical protein